MECGITTLTIEPIDGGTPDDYIISGAKPEITSSLTDSQLAIRLPEIESQEQTFEFRIKATAKGGAEKYSANIKILSVYCDYQAPSTVTDEPLSTVTKNVNEITLHSIDGSKYFKVLSE